METTTIPSKVAAELQRQYNQELGAAHSYRALSLWCETQNLKGFACYFDRQVQEEYAHAKRIAAHLVDRRVLPEHGALPAPTTQFDSLLEVAQQAHQMEQANTRGIHAAYEAALAAKDYAAQVFLHWFINEQVEEERWSVEVIERVQTAACAGSMMDLDRHIDKLLAEQLFADVT